MIFLIFFIMVAANVALWLAGLVDFSIWSVLMHFFSIALGVVLKTVIDAEVGKR